MGEIETVYAVSGRVERRGLKKVVVISVTDGKDEWRFDWADSFTISELEERFPYFNPPTPNVKQGKETE